MKQAPLHVQQQQQIDRLKMAPFTGRGNTSTGEPYANEIVRRNRAIKALAGETEEKETVFLEGSKYRIAVLSDENGMPAAYRLRQVPIDPAVDYSNAFEDFDITDNERYKINAFETAYEKFSKGNKEYDEFIERSKSTMY
jgi:hypothetical protein